MPLTQQPATSYRQSSAALPLVSPAHPPKSPSIPVLLSFVCLQLVHTLLECRSWHHVALNNIRQLSRSAILLSLFRIQSSEVQRFQAGTYVLCAHGELFRCRSLVNFLRQVKFCQFTFLLRWSQAHDYLYLEPPFVWCSLAVSSYCLESFAIH